MNPSPAPSGYALPCPTFSLSAYSVLQSGSLTATITPTSGVTQYIYTTGYVYNGSSWLPETIQGSSPYAGYSNVVSSLTLSASVLSSLPLGTIYAVEWDWTWNATQQCYLGPGTTVCNQGSWRLQQFTLMNAPTPTPMPSSSASPTPSPISGNQWYVDCAVQSSGNGSSWGSAWKSLSDITGVSPGDIVYISGSSACSTYSVSQWNPVNGTLAAPITYRVGQDAGHNSPILIALSSRPGIAGTGNVLAGIYIDGNYRGTRNMTIHGLVGASGSGTQWNGVRLSYITMDDTQIEAGTLRNFELDHSYIDLPRNSDHFYTQSQSLGPVGYSLNSIHDNTFRLRQQTGNTGTGDDGLQWIENASVYNNVFIAVLDAGQNIQHQDFIQTCGEYMAIYDNYFENAGNYPVYGDCFGSSAHWRVYNNLSVGGVLPLQHIGIGFENTSGSTLTDFIVANNTLYSSAGNNVCVSLGGGYAGNKVTNSYVVNNLCYNTGLNDIPGTGGTILESNNYQGTSNISFISTGLYPNGDFHLLSNSAAAIDKGISPSYLTGFYANDKDGITRPQGSAWDIGAYEWHQ